MAQKLCPNLLIMTTRTQQAAALLAILSDFRGTKNYYYRPHLSGLRYCYTDGIHFLAHQTYCYWLIDLILFQQSVEAMQQQAHYQLWALKRVSRRRMELIMTNGIDKGKLLAHFIVKRRGFPLDEFHCCYVHGVLMLPSEY